MKKLLIKFCEVENGRGGTGKKETTKKENLKVLLLRTGKG